MCSRPDVKFVLQYGDRRSPCARRQYGMRLVCSRRGGRGVEETRVNFVPLRHRLRARARGIRAGRPPMRADRREVSQLTVSASVRRDLVKMSEVGVGHVPKVSVAREANVYAHVVEMQRRIRGVRAAKA